MATDQSFLTQIETAISGLLDAIADDSMVEYQTPLGQRYKRADFDKLLDQLFKQRDRMKQRIARANNNPVRAVSLSFARGRSST